METVNDTNSPKEKNLSFWRKGKIPSQHYKGERICVLKLLEFHICALGNISIQFQRMNVVCLFVCLQIQWYSCHGRLKFYREREPIRTHLYRFIYIWFTLKCWNPTYPWPLPTNWWKWIIIIQIQIQMWAHYWKSGSIYQNHPHKFVKCCIFNNNMPVIARALWKHNFAHFLHLTFEYAPISKSYHKTVYTMRAMLFVFESL